MNITHKITTKSKATVSAIQLRTLSSKINLKKTLSSSDPPNPQPFVKVRLEPGQPDPLSNILGTKPNPLHRPKWKNKAQIISADDFANRPRVSFEEQFDSMHDAMVVLSWLDESQRQDIYQSYLSMMVQQEKEHKTTSHEYVMRVIAERFNLNPMRVAAIVQNCHDEEQVAKEGGLLHDKLAKYVDATIKEHIDNAYMAYGEVNPNQFVENPSTIADTETSAEVVSVDDLYDVDELSRQAILREKGDLQLLIDEKIYIEDKDQNKIGSRANEECKKLVEKVNEDFKSIGEAMKPTDDVANVLPDNGVLEDKDGNTVEATKRKRWKYVAKTINVREQKKIGKNSRRGGKLKYKQRKDNTLVEEDGIVRIATKQEVEQTSWKRERHINEFAYAGVKNAWLDRQLKGEKFGWGRVPADQRAQPQEEEAEAEADGEDVDTNSDADGSNNEAAAEGKDTKDEIDDDKK